MGPVSLNKGQDTLWACKSFYKIYKNRSHYVLSPYRATAHIQRWATSPSVDLMTCIQHNWMTLASKESNARENLTTQSRKQHTVLYPYSCEQRYTLQAWTRGIHPAQLDDTNVPRVQGLERRCSRSLTAAHYNIAHDRLKLQVAKHPIWCTTTACQT